MVVSAQQARARIEELEAENQRTRDALQEADASFRQPGRILKRARAISMIRSAINSKG